MNEDGFCSQRTRTRTKMHRSHHVFALCHSSSLHSELLSNPKHTVSPYSPTLSNKPLMHCHSETVYLPSSCVGADDGYQWMKMLDGDEYPAVHQLCDNEYMVIDINEDSNVIDYFSSYAVWHSDLGGILHLSYSIIPLPFSTFSVRTYSL